MNRNAVIAILKNWTSFNLYITKEELKENDLEKLLAFEKDNQKRRSFIQRIYTKLTKLRSQRELKGLVKKTKKRWS